MDNRDLFKFEFVNRLSEKTYVHEFLGGKKQSNILWIDGEYGVGKSFFLKKIQQEDIISKFFYLELKETNCEISCLQQLLLTIQGKASISIKKFISNNYEQLFDIGKSIALEYIKTKGIDIESLIELTFDNTKTFVKNNQKQQNALKVIIEYIGFIAKNNKIVIIIDNFEYCDSKSTNSIIELVNQLLHSDNVYFIFSTSPEGLKERKDIQQLLFEKLPIVPLIIDNFKEENLFYEILFNIFNLSREDREIIKQIFEYCCGNPEELKGMIRTLYQKHGVSLYEDKNKADWDKQILLDILSNKESSVTIKYQFNELIILKIIIAFDQCLSFDTVRKAYNYLMDNAFFAGDLAKNLFSESFFNLINLDIIRTDSNRKIVFSSDNTYRELQRKLKKDVTQALMSKYYFEFIVFEANELCNTEMSADKFEALKIHHALNAQVSDWEKISYKYLKKLYHNKHFSETIEIIQKLLAVNYFRTMSDYTMIINCFFEIGNYSTAQTLISLPVLEGTDEECIEYYLSCSKVLNIILEKESAAHELEKAIELVEPKSDRYYEFLNIKQQILVDTKDGKSEAKAIFEDFISLYEQGYAKQVIAKAFKNSIDFYHAEEALVYMGIAEEIFISHRNSLELGFLHTNRGFEQFRQGKIENAQNSFEQSIAILKDLRFYELSYPLNNLAACLMFKDEYGKAIQILTQALLINESDYVHLSVKTQLMMCYCMQKKYNACKKIMKELDNFVVKNKIDDPTILRKIYVNIAIAYYSMGERYTAHDYVSKYYSYCINTSTWYRAYKIMKEIDVTLKNPLDSCLDTEILYWSKTPFEPWLVTFSHE